jgi:hypothetical protein
MLNNRKISEIFEVQLNTLYNWQKTKPKLFKYLQNSDYNYSINEEINILLDEYSQEFQKEFIEDEIKYLINSNLILNSIDDIKNIHKNFIECEYKNIVKNRDIILDIYDKINKMNLIEKYILYKKIYKVRENNYKTKYNIISFFKEFIKN